MDGQHLTVGEASEQFNIPEHRIYQWRRDGRLTKYEREFDGVAMVDPKEIQEVLDSYKRVKKVEGK